MACPTSGDLQVRLKEPDNEFWNMIIVENHAHPIAKVEVQTRRGLLQASREEFNFWLPPGGNMGWDGGETTVVVTDINGSKKNVTLRRAEGTGSADQLACSL